MVLLKKKIANRAIFNSLFLKIVGACRVFTLFTKLIKCFKSLDSFQGRFIFLGRKMHFTRICYG